MIPMSREHEIKAAMVREAEAYIEAAKKFSQTANEMPPLMTTWGQRMGVQDVGFVTPDRTDRLFRANYHLGEVVRLLTEETIVMDA
jgi:hypothetical protein